MNSKRKRHLWLIAGATLVGAITSTWRFGASSWSAGFKKPNAAERKAGAYPTDYQGNGRQDLARSDSAPLPQVMTADEMTAFQVAVQRVLPALRTIEKENTKTLRDDDTTGVTILVTSAPNREQMSELQERLTAFIKELSGSPASEEAARKEAARLMNEYGLFPMPLKFMSINEKNRGEPRAVIGYIPDESYIHVNANNETEIAFPNGIQGIANALRGAAVRERYSHILQFDDAAAAAGDGAPPK